MMPEKANLQQFSPGHSNSSRYTDDTVDSPLYSSNEFRMYCYKVLPCSKRFPHNWQTCPFAHPGEKARRRCVRTYGYSAVPCPARQQGQECPRGDACFMTHSIFEYWLHPDMYRTQLCNDVENCKRSICFFAHSLSELRVPSLKPCARDSTQLSLANSSFSTAPMLGRTASLAQSVVSNSSTASELSGSPLTSSSAGARGFASGLQRMTMAGGSSNSTPWEDALQPGMPPPHIITCDSSNVLTLNSNVSAMQQQRQAQALGAPTDSMLAALRLTQQQGEPVTVLDISQLMQQLGLPRACSSTIPPAAAAALPSGVRLPMDALASSSTAAAQYRLVPITVGAEIASSVGPAPQLNSGLQNLGTTVPVTDLDIQPEFAQNPAQGLVYYPYGSNATAVQAVVLRGW
eukprot:GHUV01001248.1.p1 GENE.GHUV01001248.1~~GHUV01001248.1.p1  ORF type:complete len:403 (+),score=118.33 GHUV01001248.1:186-1394(+)